MLAAMLNTSCIALPNVPSNPGAARSARAATRSVRVVTRIFGRPARTTTPAALSLDGPESLSGEARYTTLEVGDFAKLDLGRTARTGLPEVVWGPGKTPEQIAKIMLALRDRQSAVMATRVDPEVYERIRAIEPSIEYDAFARVCKLAAQVHQVLAGRGAVRRPPVRFEGALEKGTKKRFDPRRVECRQAADLLLAPHSATDKGLRFQAIGLPGEATTVVVVAPPALGRRLRQLAAALRAALLHGALGDLRCRRLYALRSRRLCGPRLCGGLRSLGGRGDAACRQPPLPLRQRARSFGLARRFLGWEKKQKSPIIIMNYW